MAFEVPKCFWVTREQNPRLLWPRRNEPRKVAPQTSALAVLSMLAAICACPCTSVVLFARLQRFFHLNIDLPVLGFNALTLLALLLAIMALVRIKRSNKSLQGEEYCYFAFSFCGVWIVLAIIMSYVFNSIQFG